MTVAELLTKYGIKLASTAPGRHYTTCPHCSAGRASKEHRAAKVLGITIEADGKVHWGCNHCSWTGPEKGAGKNGNGRDGAQHAATYDYADADGALLFQKVRNAPGREPRFWLRRPDGKGGWVNGTKGVNTGILYHAPGVVRAIAEGRVVTVVEGEKDANSVRALGIIATCNAHGASELGKRPKWTRAHSEQLRGADVIVFNDNDGAGYAHADATCSLSLGVARRVRRLDLAKHWPDMPKGADVSDWLAAGHTGEELAALIEQAPDYEPPPGAKEETSPASGGGTDDTDAELERLAKLSVPDYERARKEAADRLGFRASILDRLVVAERTRLGLCEDDAKQGRAISFPEPEPWPSPVDGAALLDGIAAALGRHVIMAEHARHAAALWVVHTYLLDGFLISPRLAVRSPVKRCGKTTLLDALDRVVLKPLPTANVSAAALFRVVEAYRPTLLIDEADTFVGEADELRGVLNSGHRKGGQVLRTVGDDHEPRAFATYSAVAIGIIGNLPDTLGDRSITVDLKRKLPSEAAESFRVDRVGHLEVLARKTARWAADNAEAVARADPAMLDSLFNREADNWRPLFAIAEAAGGEWPRRVREAATKAAAGSEAASLVELLLGDIQDIFTKRKENRVERSDEIPSADLVGALVAIEGHPWAELGKSRKPLTQNGLARRLKPLGIGPGNVGPEDNRIRGYLLEQFKEAFSRYLGSEGAFKPPSRPERDEISTSDAFQSAQPSPGCAVGKSEKPNNDGLLCGCAVEKGESRQSEHAEGGNGLTPGLSHRTIAELAEDYTETTYRLNQAGSDIDSAALDADLRRRLAEMVLPEFVEVEFERVMAEVFRV